MAKRARGQSCDRSAVDTAALLIHVITATVTIVVIMMTVVQRRDGCTTRRADQRTGADGHAGDQRTCNGTCACADRATLEELA